MKNISLDDLAKALSVAKIMCLICGKAAKLKDISEYYDVFHFKCCELNIISIDWNNQIEAFQSADCDNRYGFNWIDVLYNSFPNETQMDWDTGEEQSHEYLANSYMPFKTYLKYGNFQ